MRWIFRSADPELISRLSTEACLSPLLARLLIQRGITSGEAAREFLRPDISRLHSTYRMLGMKAAVARLQAAVASRERILIYGDYDADGTLAIVILKTALELLGGSVEFHVPHRIREGYGMKDEVIEQAAAAGVRLIISVDNGIRAFAAAEAARRTGVDLIVTDHHLAEGDRVPDALAVLNPNQPGCEYPCKDLCGAGVAFKVAQALLEAAGRANLLPSFLKLVAIATVADAVPLVGENRIFVSLGLAGLRAPKNPGLKALLETAGLFPAGDRKLSAGDLGFRVGPRVNAAGRMDVACDVIEMLTTRDAQRATDLALKLDRLNAERQNEEARILKEICDTLDQTPAALAPMCLVLDGEGWHRGVIGIVATRVVERYRRPTLVISRDAASEEAHGSGRSLTCFHLLSALESDGCRPLFTRFGGHAHAVGFALPTAKIAALREAMADYAARQLTLSDLEPALEVDAEIGIEEIGNGLVQQLELLEPCGLGNREPVLVVRGATLRQPARLLKEKHLKLRVGEPGNGRAFDAIGWRMAERINESSLTSADGLDLAFTLEKSADPEFPGLQLVLRDFCAARAREAQDAHAAVTSM